MYSAIDDDSSRLAISQFKCFPLSVPAHDVGVFRRRRSPSSSSSDSETDKKTIDRRIEAARKRDEEQKWLEAEKLKLA